MSAFGVIIVLCRFAGAAEDVLPPFDGKSLIQDDPLKEWLDPFREGWEANLGFTVRQNGFRNLDTLQLGASRGFDGGITLGASIPLVLSDSNPTTLNAKAPRLGGGALGRAALSVSARVWGDLYDYFAVSAAFGLPYQTDQASSNSNLSSWVFPITAFGRLDWRWVALEASFTDTLTTDSVRNFPQSSDYVDTTNGLTLTAKWIFYPSKRVSIRLSYTEDFPTSADVGTDSSSSAVLLRTTHQPASSNSELGLDVAPFKAGVILSVTARYFFKYQPIEQSALAYGGAVQWDF